MIETGRVGMIPVENIVLTDRARKAMGDLDGLELNMKESGLIQPLAVKDNSDGTFTLLAGERRFTVLKRNEVALIPARIYERDLTLLEMKVIENAENFHRKDMEFYEYDALALEIHNMKQEALGAKAAGPGGSGWSTSDTGEMLGISQPSVSQALARAQAREVYPELFESCKTAADATKILKKVSEEAIKEAIARKLECDKSETDLNRIASHFIIKDFFEGVKEIPEKTFNLVEIDPPYAINLQAQKKKDGESQYSLASYNEITPEKYAELMPKLFSECYRVMADHSWLIVWFAPHPWFETMYQWIKGAGFGVTRLCGIWTKGTPGQSMNPSIRLANSYEMFFYAWKGSPALNKAGHGNDFHFPPVPAQQKVHPTERPIELMKDLYETFAFPGSRVLIPFLGSGNGLLAANALGMPAVGFDLSRSYKNSFLVKANSMFSK
jgi:DNA modification methylase